MIEYLRYLIAIAALAGMLLIGPYAMVGGLIAWVTQDGLGGVALAVAGWVVFFSSFQYLKNY